MYQKILVAVDISDEARQILKKAAEISKMYQAQVSILHVADLPITGYDGLFGESILVNEQDFKEALYPNLVEMVEEQRLPKGQRASSLAGRLMSFSIKLSMRKWI